MSALVRLFGSSPFAPLHRHLEQVCCCVNVLPLICQELFQGNSIDEYVEQIFKLEHEANVLEQQIRHHLYTSFFLPIPKTDLVQVLSLQQALAQHAQNIAFSFSLVAHLAIKFQSFYPQLLSLHSEAFHELEAILKIWVELIESAFGAQKLDVLQKKVDHIFICEQKAIILQRDILRQLFNQESSYNYVYHKIIEETALIAHICLKLANHVCMTLERKI